jgi:hypothetical protein
VGASIQDDDAAASDICTDGWLPGNVKPDVDLSLGILIENINDYMTQSLENTDIGMLASDFGCCWSGPNDGPDGGAGTDPIMDIMKWTWW